MSPRPSVRVERFPARSETRYSLRCPDVAAFGGFSPVGSPRHRPAAAFGARRAFTPARRPAVPLSVLPSRSPSATSGRLGGLLRDRCPLLRGTRPEGAPRGIVPIETQTLAAQYRVPHARRCVPLRSLDRASGSRAPLKENRLASARSAAGGCPAPVPGVSDVRPRRGSTPRAPRSTRRGAPATWSVWGPWRGARRPPVAQRFDAVRNSFSGAWHPPRAFRRTSSAMQRIQRGSRGHFSSPVKSPRRSGGG
jgi:hypothetical protein